ncbi:MAG: hypothetical protein QXQ02_07275 [Halobacteria archaeon]
MEFIFRFPSGEVAGKARNLEEFREAIDILPIASIEFHHLGRHFRPWLRDLGHEKLAEEFEKVEESGEELRRKLLSITRRYIRRVKLYGADFK